MNVKTMVAHEIDPMIMHTLKLDDTNRGFDPMHAGESIRSAAVS